MKLLDIEESWISTSTAFSAAISMTLALVLGYTSGTLAFDRKLTLQIDVDHDLVVEGPFFLVSQ